MAIAQSLRDKESRQAEFDAAVQGKQAEAEQSGPLATAIARQKVTEQETRIEQVRKQQEVLVQAQEAARAGAPGDRRQAAEAQRQAAILLAEGEKQATVIRAEATQKELEFEGAGEAPRRSSGSAAPRPRRCWRSAKPKRK